MSYRRSISFSESEEDLLRYFDQNGKSEIAKISMRFYREHKDNVITKPVLKLLSLIEKHDIEATIHQKSKPTNHSMVEKFAKLKK